jgi:hypothetical protein
MSSLTPEVTGWLLKVVNSGGLAIQRGVRRADVRLSSEAPPVEPSSTESFW